jgi:hypothetical protein
MMNWRFIKYPISFFFVSIFLTGCIQSEYTKMVKSELAKGVRHDSILLGIRLGDTQSEFRDKCFALNRKHLATEGPGFYVQYLFEDSLSHNKPTSIRLLFKPDFDNKDRITDMDLKFNYLGWAPWNRQYQSDSLKIRIIKMLERWYAGNKFVTAHTGDKDIPVKVDGNRRIFVLEEVPQTVVVKVQDILHPKYKETIK